VRGAIATAKTLARNGKIRSATETQLEEMARLALTSKEEIASGIGATQSTARFEARLAYGVPEDRLNEISSKTKEAVCNVQGSAFDAWQPDGTFHSFEDYLTYTYTNTVQSQLKSLIGPKYRATRDTVSGLITNYNNFMKKCTKDVATCKDAYVLAVNLACAAP
jgi:hypothetical protein